MRTVEVHAVDVILRSWSRLASRKPALRTLAAAICLVLVASCTGSATASVASAQAEDSGGQFQLVFQVPRADWHASDSITGQATLSYLGSGGADIGAERDSPIAFGFAEVGGTRQITPASRLMCAPYRLDAGQPIISPIKKSGGWPGQDPNAGFYQSFFADPLIHLPAGDWTITAVTDFYEGAGCSMSAPHHTLRAAVTVHVTA